MDLSVSIVSWNTRDLLDACLSSVFDGCAGIDIEVVVVDNLSSDDSVAMVRSKYPRVRVLANERNVGFSAANNQAYNVSSGRHFLLLNPDTVVRQGSLQKLVRFLDDHAKAGAVGPLVLNPDGSLQYSWARFPTLWREAFGRLDRRIVGLDRVPATAEEVRSLDPFQADWIGGCCLMIKREAISQIGPMDESLFMYCEETDWCMRLKRAGWEVWIEPGAEIVHYGGQSSALASDKCEMMLSSSKVALMKKNGRHAQARILQAAFGCRAIVKRALRLRRALLKSKASVDGTP